MRLVDSHCHLQADRFDDDVERVVDAARGTGVERILVPGWNVDSSRAALELAGRIGGLDVGVGVHPHDAAKVDGDEWAGVEALASDPRVAAIGETGLDYDRVFSPTAAQLVNLRRNLALAVRSGKPAIVHCRSTSGERDAQDALLRELRAFEGATPRVLVHSFSGPVDYAEAMLDLGAVISFSGLVFRRGEEASAEVARLAPSDRILVETDAPYLSPPGAPRRRNEPAWVAVTARWLAAQRGIDEDALGELLVDNYDRLLRTAQPGPSTSGPQHGFEAGSRRD